MSTQNPTPFYRTGDLVALDTTTGALHFRGRRDQQIKLNGVRIELAEIEAAMTALDGVTACVVSLGPSDRPSLHAHYAVEAGRTIDAARVRRHLSELLPSTHVPQHYTQVTAFAVGPTGKIDRGRLGVWKEGQGAGLDPLGPVAPDPWTSERP